MNNQLNMWYLAQLVTQGQMNDFSKDLYYRIGFLTDAYESANGCIINLPTVTQVGGNVTLSAGSFRFPNTTLGYLIYTPPLIGNAPPATVAVSGNGFLVAQYIVAPTGTNYEYVFTCSYAFVPTVLTNMVKIVGITGGVINNGNWGVFSSTPSINDITPFGYLGITPTNTLSIDTADIVLTASATVTANADNFIVNTTAGNNVNQTTGGYTASFTTSNNGTLLTQAYIQSISDSDATIFGQYYTRFFNAGNGVFKPQTGIIAQNGDNQYATFFAQGQNNGSAANYVGFYSAHKNYISNTIFGTQELYSINNGTDMIATLYVDAGGTSATGFEMETSNRPTLIGNLSTLAQASNCIMVMQDINSGSEVVGSGGAIQFNFSIVNGTGNQHGFLTFTASGTGLAGGYNSGNIPLSTFGFTNSIIPIISTIYSAGTNGGTDGLMEQGSVDSTIRFIVVSPGDYTWSGVIVW